LSQPLAKPPGVFTLYSEKLVYIEAAVIPGEFWVAKALLA
jgi:hypothetical protein